MDCFPGDFDFTIANELMRGTIAKYMALPIDDQIASNESYQRKKARIDSRRFEEYDREMNSAKAKFMRKHPSCFIYRVDISEKQKEDRLRSIEDALAGKNLFKRRLFKHREWLELKPHLIDETTFDKAKSQLNKII